MGLNWQQFQAELESDFKRAVVDEYGKLCTDVVVQAAEVMEQLVPRGRTGGLAESISASAGTERKGARGGSSQVRGVMKRRGPFENVFLMVNKQTASLLERGTVHHSPRPFFRPALESVANIRR